MKIDAGKLDRRLVILSRYAGTAPTASQDALGQVQDTLGQTVEGWAPTASTYAQRLELRTADAMRAGNSDTYAVSRYLIRYRTDLTTRDRIEVDGLTYDIRSIDEPDRRETLVLTVEQVLS